MPPSLKMELLYCSLGFLLFIGLEFASSAPYSVQGNPFQLARRPGRTPRMQGCYHEQQHYKNGEHIATKEPCLNCTCIDSALMCYLRVCPFVKPLGEKCVEKKHDNDCCPEIWCPGMVNGKEKDCDDPDHEGYHDHPGCYLDNKYYRDGDMLPADPSKPCEVCYCMQNKTSCVVQQCELKVQGCNPVYIPGQCCPCRYNCSYDEETTTVPPGFSVHDLAEGCILPGGIFVEDGAAINSTDPCEHCYCMRSEIICTVHQCSYPAANCIGLHTKPGECCPDSYQCSIGGAHTLLKDEDGNISNSTTLHTVKEEHVIKPIKGIGIKGAPSLIFKPVVSHPASEEDKTTLKPLSLTTKSTVHDVKGSTDIEEEKIESAMIETSAELEEVSNISHPQEFHNELKDPPRFIIKGVLHDTQGVKEIPKVSPSVSTEAIIGVTVPKFQETSSISSEAEGIVKLSVDPIIREENKPISVKIHSLGHNQLSQKEQGISHFNVSDTTMKRPSIKTSGVKGIQHEIGFSVKGGQSSYPPNVRPNLPVGAIPGESIRPGAIKRPWMVSPVGGGCRVGKKFYQNGQAVDSHNLCKINCRCINGMIYCDDVICESPPKDVLRCVRIRIANECCPRYECPPTKTPSSSPISTVATKTTTAEPATAAPEAYLISHSVEKSETSDSDIKHSTQATLPSHSITNTFDKSSGHFEFENAPATFAHPDLLELSTISAETQKTTSVPTIGFESTTDLKHDDTVHFHVSDSYAEPTAIISTESQSSENESLSSSNETRIPFDSMSDTTEDISLSSIKQFTGLSENITDYLTTQPSISAEVNFSVENVKSFATVVTEIVDGITELHDQTTTEFENTKSTSSYSTNEKETTSYKNPIDQWESTTYSTLLQNKEKTEYSKKEKITIDYERATHSDILSEEKLFSTTSSPQVEDTEPQRVQTDQISETSLFSDTSDLPLLTTEIPSDEEVTDSKSSGTIEVLSSSLETTISQSNEKITPSSEMELNQSTDSQFITKKEETDSVEKVPASSTTLSLVDENKSESPILIFIKTDEPTSTDFQGSEEALSTDKLHSTLSPDLEEKYFLISNQTINHPETDESEKLPGIKEILNSFITTSPQFETAKAEETIEDHIHSTTSKPLSIFEIKQSTTIQEHSDFEADLDKKEANGTQLENNSKQEELSSLTYESTTLTEPETTTRFALPSSNSEETVIHQQKLTTTAKFQETYQKVTVPTDTGVYLGINDNSTETDMKELLSDSDQQSTTSVKATSLNFVSDSVKFDELDYGESEKSLDHPITSHAVNDETISTFSIKNDYKTHLSSTTELDLESQEVTKDDNKKLTFNEDRYEFSTSTSSSLDIAHINDSKPTEITPSENKSNIFDYVKTFSEPFSSTSEDKSIFFESTSLFPTTLVNNDNVSIHFSTTQEETEVSTLEPKEVSSTLKTEASLVEVSIAYGTTEHPTVIPDTSVELTESTSEKMKSLSTTVVPQSTLNFDKSESENYSEHSIAEQHSSTEATTDVKLTTDRSSISTEEFKDNDALITQTKNRVFFTEAPSTSIEFTSTEKATFVDTSKTSLGDKFSYTTLEISRFTSDKPDNFFETSTEVPDTTFHDSASESMTKAVSSFTDSLKTSVENFPTTSASIENFKFTDDGTSIYSSSYNSETTPEKDNYSDTGVIVPESLVHKSTTKEERIKIFEIFEANSKATQTPPTSSPSSESSFIELQGTSTPISLSQLNSQTTSAISQFVSDSTEKSHKTQLFETTVLLSSATSLSPDNASATVLIDNQSLDSTYSENNKNHAFVASSLIIEEAVEKNENISHIPHSDANASFEGQQISHEISDQSPTESELDHVHEISTVHISSSPEELFSMDSENFKGSSLSIAVTNIPKESKPSPSHETSKGDIVFSEQKSTHTESVTDLESTPHTFRPTTKYYTSSTFSSSLESLMQSNISESSLIEEITANDSEEILSILSTDENDKQINNVSSIPSDKEVITQDSSNGASQIQNNIHNIKSKTTVPQVHRPESLISSTESIRTNVEMNDQPTTAKQFSTEDYADSNAIFTLAENLESKSPESITGSDFTDTLSSFNNEFSEITDNETNTLKLNEEHLKSTTTDILTASDGLFTFVSKTPETASDGLFTLVSKTPETTSEFSTQNSVEEISSTSGDLLVISSTAKDTTTVLYKKDMMATALDISSSDSSYSTELLEIGDELGKNKQETTSSSYSDKQSTLRNSLYTVTDSSETNESHINVENNTYATYHSISDTKEDYTSVDHFGELSTIKTVLIHETTQNETQTAPSLIQEDIGTNNNEDVLDKNIFYTTLPSQNKLKDGLGIQENVFSDITNNKSLLLEQVTVDYAGFTRPTKSDADENLISTDLDYSGISSATKKDTLPDSNILQTTEETKHVENPSESTGFIMQDFDQKTYLTSTEIPKLTSTEKSFSTDNQYDSSITKEENISTDHFQDGILVNSSEFGTLPSLEEKKSSSPSILSDTTYVTEKFETTKDTFSHEYKISTTENQKNILKTVSDAHHFDLATSAEYSNSEHVSDLNTETYPTENEPKGNGINSSSHLEFEKAPATFAQSDRLATFTITSVVQETTSVPTTVVENTTDLKTEDSVHFHVTNYTAAPTIVISTESQSPENESISTYNETRATFDSEPDTTEDISLSSIKLFTGSSEITDYSTTQSSISSKVSFSKHPNINDSTYASEQTTKYVPSTQPSYETSKSEFITDAPSLKPLYNFTVFFGDKDSEQSTASTQPSHETTWPVLVTINNHAGPLRPIYSYPTFSSAKDTAQTIPPTRIYSEVVSFNNHFPDAKGSYPPPTFFTKKYSQDSVASTRPYSEFIFDKKISNAKPTYPHATFFTEKDSGQEIASTQPYPEVVSFNNHFPDEKGSYPPPSFVGEKDSEESIASTQPYSEVVESKPTYPYPTFFGEKDGEQLITGLSTENDKSFETEILKIIDGLTQFTDQTTSKSEENKSSISDPINEHETTSYKNPSDQSESTTSTQSKDKTENAEEQKTTTDYERVTHTDILSTEGKLFSTTSSSHVKDTEPHTVQTNQLTKTNSYPDRSHLTLLTTKSSQTSTFDQNKYSDEFIDKVTTENPSVILTSLPKDGSSVILSAEVSDASIYIKTSTETLRNQNHSGTDSINVDFTSPNEESMELIPSSTPFNVDVSSEASDSAEKFEHSQSKLVTLKTELETSAEDVSTLVLIHDSMEKTNETSWNISKDQDINIFTESVSSAETTSFKYEQTTNNAFFSTKGTFSEVSSTDQTLFTGASTSTSVQDMGPTQTTLLNEDISTLSPTESENFTHLNILKTPISTVSSSLQGIDILSESTTLNEKVGYSQTIKENGDKEAGVSSKEPISDDTYFETGTVSHDSDISVTNETSITEKPLFYDNVTNEDIIEHSTRGDVSKDDTSKEEVSASSSESSPEKEITQTTVHYTISDLNNQMNDAISELSKADNVTYALKNELPDETEYVTKLQSEAPFVEDVHEDSKPSTDIIHTKKESSTASPITSETTKAHDKIESDNITLLKKADSTKGETEKQQHYNTTQEESDTEYESTHTYRPYDITLHYITTTSAYISSEKTEEVTYVPDVTTKKGEIFISTTFDTLKNDSEKDILTDADSDFDPHSTVVTESPKKTHGSHDVFDVPSEIHGTHSLDNSVDVLKPDESIQLVEDDIETVTPDGITHQTILSEDTFDRTSQNEEDTVTKTDMKTFSTTTLTPISDSSSSTYFDTQKYTATDFKHDVNSSFISTISDILNDTSVVNAFASDKRETIESFVTYEEEKSTLNDLTALNQYSTPTELINPNIQIIENYTTAVKDESTTHPHDESFSLSTIHGERFSDVVENFTTTTTQQLFSNSEHILGFPEIEETTEKSLDSTNSKSFTDTSAVNEQTEINNLSSTSYSFLLADQTKYQDESSSDKNSSEHSLPSKEAAFGFTESTRDTHQPSPSAESIFGLSESEKNTEEILDSVYNKSKTEATAVTEEVYLNDHSSTSYPFLSTDQTKYQEESSPSKSSSVHTFPSKEATFGYTESTTPQPFPSAESIFGFTEGEKSTEKIFDSIYNKSKTDASAVNEEVDLNNRSSTSYPFFITEQTEHQDESSPASLKVPSPSYEEYKQKLSSTFPSGSSFNENKVNNSLTELQQRPHQSTIKGVIDEMCYFEGRYYRSSQQIPREDVCDFCFCFRGEIICLQQTCPPPIGGCYAIPIEGFCCPMYHCPVQQMWFNISMTPTTPNPFRIFSQRPAVKPGCQIEGQLYQLHQIVPNNNNCMLCRCEYGGMMKCYPRLCTPKEEIIEEIIEKYSKRK